MSRLSGRSLTFYLMASVSIIMLIVSSSGGAAPVEDAAGQGARPLLTLFNNVGRQITSGLGTARELATLRERNQELQSIANTLTIDYLRLEEVAGENERLRRLLQFRQTNPLWDFRGGQVIGQVISKGPSNYLQTIRIDLGSNQGIAEDMPVITELGLVGRIYRVEPDSSLVLLITDPSSGVNAMTRRERVVGVVNGQAGGLPTMNFVAQADDLVPGDVLITSGLGGTFPKNLVIGQVIGVRKRDFDMFQTAEVQPTVDFGRLEIVLVITSFKPLPGEPEELETVG